MTSHKFQFGGRRRVIFQRAAGRSAAWYFRFTAAGRTVTRTLETSDRDTAVEAAKSILRQLELEPSKVQQYLDNTGRDRVVSATVGELFAAYRRLARAIGCVESNIAALRNIHRRVHGPDCAAEQLSLDEVNEDLVWRFKQVVLDTAAGQPEERAAQLQRSANSILRQARSLFTKDLLPQYQRLARLAVPDCVRAFHDAPGFDGVAKTDYQKPDDAILRKTFTALAVLPSDPDHLNLYKAVWLTLGWGLRLSEVADARWSWFKQVDGATVIRTDILGKDGYRSEIPAQLGAWEKLQPYAPSTINHQPSTTTDYILTGSPTKRYAVGREAAAWMHSLGWRTQKSLHEFRAYAGCQVGQTQGWDAAQQFLRHKDLSTTQRSYGRYYRIQLRSTPLVIPGDGNVLTLPRTAENL